MLAVNAGPNFGFRAGDDRKLNGSHGVPDRDGPGGACRDSESRVPASGPLVRDRINTTGMSLASFYVTVVRVTALSESPAAGSGSR